MLHYFHARIRLTRYQSIFLLDIPIGKTFVVSSQDRLFQVSMVTNAIKLGFRVRAGLIKLRLEVYFFKTATKKLIQKKNRCKI